MPTRMHSPPMKLPSFGPARDDPRAGEHAPKGETIRAPLAWNIGEPNGERGRGVTVSANFPKSVAEKPKATLILRGGSESEKIPYRGGEGPVSQSETFRHNDVLAFTPPANPLSALIGR